MTSYTLTMRWRSKTTEVRGAPRTFVHISVQLDLHLAGPHLDRPFRTKVVDRLMEPATARAFLGLVRAGARGAGTPLTEVGDFFAHPTTPPGL